jgi:hypothetical protein
VNATQARALLAQGKKDGTFEAPIPEDDTKAISEANDLVEMAETAWAQMVRGPEVEVLLKMAAEATNGDAPEQKSEPEPDPPAEGSSEETEPVAETPAEPQPESPPGDDLSKIEPWEGYDREKVSDILAGINAATREYDENDLTDLMANVWAYEQAHKSRATILKHLETVAAKLQAGEDIPADPADSSDDYDPGESHEPDGGGSDPAPEEPQAEETPKADPDPAESGEPERSGDPEADAKAAETPAEHQGEGTGDPASSGTPKETQSAPEKEAPRDHRDLDQVDDYQRLIKTVDEDLERERIHKAKPPEEEIPDLPWDWTKMSDKELQKFHGIYSALAYYKSYQMSRDERLALHCKAAADELHNALLVAAEKIDEHGKEKRVATLEAEIESDENVIAWRRRQRKHETYAASHRNERDSISKIVEALSRHETMRQDEWERSGQRGGRGK